MTTFYLLIAQAADDVGDGGMVAGLAGTLAKYGPWAVTAVCIVAIVFMARYIIKLQERLEKKPRDEDDKFIRGVQDDWNEFESRFFGELENIRNTYTAVIEEKTGTIERISTQKDAEVQKLFDKVQERYQIQLDQQEKVLASMNIISEAATALQQQQEILRQINGGGQQ